MSYTIDPYLSALLSQHADVLSLRYPIAWFV